MASFSDYAESFVPKRYVILGVELKPLSLGHYLLMRKFGSNFATDEDGATVGYDDFMLSLVICSMSYNEFLDFIDNKEYGRPVKKWYAPWCVDNNYFINTLKKQGKKLAKRIKKEKISMNDLKAKMDMFVQYLKEGTETPKYWDGENEGKESGAHWSQSVFTTAISELNYTRNEALNTPLRQLFNDFFKYAESQGSVQLMSASELKQIEK